MHPSRLLLGLFFLVSLVVTGCNSSNIKCDDPLGCVSYANNKPILIASALNISGPNKNLGLDSQYGVEIAIDLKGDIFGHHIKLKTKDTACSEEGGQTAGKDIVSDDSIIAVIGSTCSTSGLGMVEIISEAGYVMVSPSDTAFSLTDPEQDWKPGFLRVARNDKFDSLVFAEFAYYGLGVRTAVTIHDRESYSEGLAMEFANSFSKFEGTTVESIEITRGNTIMHQIIETVVAAGPPDLIYYPVFMPENVMITQQANEIPELEDTFLSTIDNLISPGGIVAIGDAGEGLFVSGNDQLFSGELYEKLIARYKIKFNLDKPLSNYHAYAFDAANLIFTCIEKVGMDDHGTLHIGRLALRNCLYSTTDVPGITGTFTCNEFGDCANHKVSISQLVDGEFIRVWP